MNRKVITAGHICLDITPVITGAETGSVSDFFRPGGLIQVGEAVFSTGGAVANTGLAMKKFGADVSLIGKIGRDPFGDTVKKLLDEYGAGEDLVISDDEPTSYTIILAVPGIDRMFLHAPGADASFSADDIPEQALCGAALMHFGYPTAMRNMYISGGEELIRLMKYAKDCGCATSLDLAALDPGTEAAAQDWHAIIRDVLPYTDFFVPSIEELCSMIDPGRYEQWTKQAAGRDVCTVLDVEEDVRPLAEQCIAWGAKAVLLKCGVLGMYLCTADAGHLRDIGERLELDTADWAERRLYENSYQPDRIISATGCGDVSIAAFLVSLLNGEAPEECLKLACAAGAACITEINALSGLESLEALKERIRNGWKKTGE